MPLVLRVSHFVVVCICLIMLASLLFECLSVSVTGLSVSVMGGEQSVIRDVE